MLTVQKFGGSSLASEEKLRRAAALVRREIARGRSVAVVVSAMGDATDELLAMAYSLSSAPSGRELDALLSTGECASAALLAITLEEAGQSAASFTGWQSGIFTDEAHGDARILTLTASRLRAALSRGVVPVVSGFQGIDSAGDLTTLGRGGSDTTAVALAAALHADSCDIYTDVDGIYTADPRLVPSARLLAAADIRDMLRLSYAGAQVLHCRCLELALEKGVALTLRPAQNDGPGTRVALLPDAERPALAGLAGRGERVTLVGRASAEQQDALPEILRAAGIRVLDVGSGRDEAWASIPPDRCAAALRALHARFFED